MADFKPYTESELREIDRKVNKEMKRINVIDWTVSLLTVGVLWALYERLKKPIFKNLDIFTAANISKDHILGKRRPGGALAKVENIKDVLPFNRIQKNMLRFAQVSAEENIAQMADRTKHTIRLMLVRSKLQGTSAKELAEQMRLTFKGLDRDWRRIVVTESASIATNGYIMSQGEGQQIIGQSAVDACPWCKSMIHGKIFTVTHTAPQTIADAHWESHIWPGKNNVLRSRHAKKMGGKKRGPGELWKPTIPMHPHCFPPGQMVRCPDGFRRIEDLSAGDYVVGHSGKSRKIIKVHNSRYVGKLFSINSGAFASTHNHPIFVYGRGWVEAQKIKKGDRVLSAKSVFLHPNDKEPPSMSSKHFLLGNIVFDFPGSSVPSSTMNLDGYLNLRNSNINIIFPNGPESASINIIVSKKRNHRRLSEGNLLHFIDILRSGLKSFKRLFFSTNSVMSGDDLSFSLRRCHPRPFHFFGIRPFSPFKSKISKSITKTCPRDSDKAGERKNAFSGKMLSVCAKDIKNYSVVHNLLYHIVDVNSILESKYAGPVYNLTIEDDETYLIGKESFLVHNCRCRWVAFNPRFHEVTATGSVKAR